MKITSNQRINYDFDYTKYVFFKRARVKFSYTRVCEFLISRKNLEMFKKFADCDEKVFFKEQKGTLPAMYVPHC